MADIARMPIADIHRRRGRVPDIRKRGRWYIYSSVIRGTWTGAYKLE